MSTEWTHHTTRVSTKWATLGIGMASIVCNFRGYVSGACRVNVSSQDKTAATSVMLTATIGTGRLHQTMRTVLVAGILEWHIDGSLRDRGVKHRPEGPIAFGKDSYTDPWCANRETSVLDAAKAQEDLGTGNDGWWHAPPSSATEGSMTLRRRAHQQGAGRESGKTAMSIGIN